MRVKVQMLAFEDEDNVVREVTIPDERAAECQTEEQLWGLAYHYGQNDFAVGPEKNTTCSVSAGDVIDHDGKLVLYRWVGYDTLTPKQLAEYKAVNQRERHFLPLVIGKMPDGTS